MSIDHNKDCIFIEVYIAHHCAKCIASRRILMESGSNFSFSLGKPDFLVIVDDSLSIDLRLNYVDLEVAATSHLISQLLHTS